MATVGQAVPVAARVRVSVRADAGETPAPRRGGAGVASSQGKAVVVRGDLGERGFGVNGDDVAGSCGREACDGHAGFEIERGFDGSEGVGGDELAPAFQDDADGGGWLDADVVDADFEGAIGVERGVDRRESEVGAVEQVVELAGLRDGDEGDPPGGQVERDGCLALECHGGV